VHESAVLDAPVTLEDGVRVWHFCHLSKDVHVGQGSTLGQNVFVAQGVRIGKGVKIQNNVSIYDGVVLEDDVFVGPSAVFTNVANPRAEISRRGQYVRTLIRQGATIGANATVVCGADIGRYAFVGAGAVVTRGTVPDYSLMLGVPAAPKGWVGRHGYVLGEPDDEGIRRCPETGWRYRETEPWELRCLDWDEEKRLVT
jgi:UDP-2-acetamido-3-amino-2,3-dideoxy-glucuronate N-acetyltransferase